MAMEGEGGKSENFKYKYLDDDSAQIRVERKSCRLLRVCGKGCRENCKVLRRDKFDAHFEVLFRSLQRRKIILIGTVRRIQSHSDREYESICHSNKMLIIII